MNKANKMIVSTLAILGFTHIAGTAMADFYETAPRRDVDLCVAEIKENVDYAGAGHVRHEVESTKRRGVGYALTIDTSVYGDTDDEAMREYKAVCIVTGGRKPLSFSISTVGDGA